MDVQIPKKLLIEEYSFTEKESDFFISLFEERRIKKRQYIVQPGFVVKHRFFVVKGAFRTYILDKDGQEKTISLAIDRKFISGYNSYIYQLPANFIVEALENSIILQLHFKDEQMLKAFSHKYETFFRTIAERILANKQQRLISCLTLSAEERYNQFIKKYPDYLNRIPQFILASYLGMSSQYLSKIKNKLI